MSSAPLSKLYQPFPTEDQIAVLETLRVRPLTFKKEEQAAKVLEECGYASVCEKEARTSCGVCKTFLCRKQTWIGAMKRCDARAFLKIYSAVAPGVPLERNIVIIDFNHPHNSQCYKTRENAPSPPAPINWQGEPPWKLKMLSKAAEKDTTSVAKDLSKPHEEQPLTFKTLADARAFLRYQIGGWRFCSKFRLKKDNSVRYGFECTKGLRRGSNKCKAQRWITEHPDGSATLEWGGRREKQPHTCYASPIIIPDAVEKQISLMVTTAVTKPTPTIIASRLNQLGYPVPEHAQLQKLIDVKRRLLYEKRYKLKRRPPPSYNRRKINRKRGKRPRRTRPPPPSSSTASKQPRLQTYETSHCSLLVEPKILLSMFLQ